ncbi:MAG: hypothetical protein ACI9EF_000925 [Pseudohongiellaceae bacterium]|jgi:hypothetical protein
MDWHSTTAEAAEIHQKRALSNENPRETLALWHFGPHQRPLPRHIKETESAPDGESNSKEPPVTCTSFAVAR